MNISKLGSIRFRRWRQLLFVIAVPITLAAAVRADFPKDLSEAARPIEEGVPEVSIVRLNTLLKTTLSPAQRREAAGKLIEALVAAKRPAEALELMAQQNLPQTAAERFWRAQALAASGRPNDALPIYEQLAADSNFPMQAEAVLATADMLRKLGRLDDAAARLTPLAQNKRWKTRASLRLASLFLDKADWQSAQRALQGIADENTAERKQHRFLRGRLELVQHHPDRALGYLEPLTKRPREVSHPLMVATLCLIGDAHLQLKTAETGDDFLEDFIDRHPADAALPLLFAKLDELYRAEKKPVRLELERWARESEQPRRGLAQWYLARIELRAGRTDHARQLLSDLRTSRANRTDLAGGLLELAELEILSNNPTDVVAIAEEAKAWQPVVDISRRLEFLAARAEYVSGRFAAATSRFEKVGGAPSAFAPPAWYNASLGWLQMGDRGQFAAAYDQAQAQGASPDDRAELRLQEALVRARQQQPDAVETLRKFVDAFPQNPRVSEALVALAEIAFHQNPPQNEQARKLLARAESHPTDVARERAQYLTIWIEDATAANSDRVIELSKRFLNDQPHSTSLGEVRMKLAEAYYSRQDFSNAQTQFELFAQQNPGSPFLEKALFFAGESAMGSMAPHTLDRAITLFAQVAQMNGDLRWAARNEQAIIERKLGKPEDALLLYDEVLKSGARPPEKREALCGKGDIYLELSTGDPKNYERAIQAYDQLVASAIEGGHWHNQALFKKGVCLEKKADAEGALATFFQVLDTPARTDRPPELFWYYKAGFNAARLLESGAHWDSAAKVYQKLVAAGGSRSEEARARLNQLRLEHFLWSD
ncbi:MAG: tetratricopeptide repeat protein [Chthoniobacterales bacterium]